MNFTISFHQILPGVPGAVSVAEKIIPGFTLGDMNLCIQKGHGRKAFKRENYCPYNYMISVLNTRCQIHFPIPLSQTTESK
ncbi:hypothetical protein CEXT_511091, partial [Caerostris extrusa]